MYELFQILLHNPDLPVLTLLTFFLLTRVNAIDKKITTICTRLDMLENLMHTVISDMKNGIDKRSKTKLSEREQRQSG